MLRAAAQKVFVFPSLRVSCSTTPLYARSMGSSSSSSSNGSSNNSYDTEENKRRLMRITIVKLKEIILNHNASLPPESKRKKVPLSGLCKDDLIDKLLKLDWAASPTTEEIIKSMLDPLPSSSTKGKKTKPAPKYKTPLAENSNCPEPEPETVLKPKPPPPPPPPPPPLTTPTTNHQLKTGKNFTKAWISETSHSLGWVQKSPPFSLHLPPQFFVENRVTVPIPWGLSPSSSSEFNACPQSYLFRYLLKVPALPGLALQRGTLIHEVLEKIFDQDWGSERSNEDEINNWAVDEFRRLWGKEREKSQIVYDELFQDDDSGSGSGSVSGGGNVNVNGNGNGNGNSDDNDNNNHKSHLSRTQKQLKMESEWGGERAKERKWLSREMATATHIHYSANPPYSCNSLVSAAESLKILSNYFEMEQEEIFFDEPPIAREMWVNETADLGKKKGEGAKVRGIVGEASEASEP